MRGSGGRNPPPPMPGRNKLARRATPNRRRRRAAGETRGSYIACGRVRARGLAEPPRSRDLSCSTGLLLRQSRCPLPVHIVSGSARVWRGGRALSGTPLGGVVKRGRGEYGGAAAAMMSQRDTGRGTCVSVANLAGDCLTVEDR
jgi:hypothetical protein